MFSKRDRAWQISKLPCIGQWIFVEQSLLNFPEFHTLLNRIRKGSSVLDLGCCFGQDLRLFAAHGAPTDSMYGIDINEELWNLGYELFRDREKMHAAFFKWDILDENLELVELIGKCDIVIACQFFHLFSLQDQKKALKRCVRLCSEHATLVGYQRGQLEPRNVQRPWGEMYIHNVFSLQKLWEAVSEETNTNWDVHCSVIEFSEWGMEPEDFEWMPRGCNFIKFVCQRLS